jgi:serine/threonine-protein kinase RsbW
VQIILSLALPRDEYTIPVARHIVKNALTEVGVGAECTGDIEVALSEACTNVIKHSGPGDEFQVSLELDPELCTIRVIDTGHGFDWESLDTRSDLSAERGRGVELMRALVDSVKFESKPETGTIVHLEKRLDLDEQSIVHRMR